MAAKNKQIKKNRGTIQDKLLQPNDAALQLPRRSPHPDDQIPVKGANKARILVVDDHALIRLAVREIISQEPDLEVCGEAPDEETAMRLLEKMSPHLVLLDLSLGEDFGLELLKRIVKKDASHRILVLSIHDEMLYAERALRAGAMGYLNKRETPDTILAAIRSVLAGKIHVNPKIADHFLHRFGGRKIPSRRGGTEKLSDREMQTFELIGAGLGSRDIAARLRVSVKTIEVYRQRIKQKLGLASGVELVRRAVEWVIAGG